MKKLRIIFFCALIFIGIIGSIFYIVRNLTQGKNYQKDIDTIYFYHWHVLRMPEYKTAYKIDLTNKSIYEVVGEKAYDSDNWGTIDGDDDFILVSYLQDDAIELFSRQTARHGLTKLDSTYKNIQPDGSAWYIKIIFSDKTVMTSSGSNKYPETWDIIMKDFDDLTGIAFSSLPL